MKRILSILTLAAVSVANLDASVGWYADNLDFRLNDRRDFPDRKLRIALIERQGFFLEHIPKKPPYVRLRHRHHNQPPRNTHVPLLGKGGAFPWTGTELLEIL